MRNTLISCVVVSLAVVGNASNTLSADMPPALKQLVEAANKEGEVKVMWSANAFGGPSGAKLFQERLEAVYGAKVRVVWSPGKTSPEIGAQVALTFANGLPSPTDVYYGAARNMADLQRSNMFLPAPWRDYAPDRLTAQIVEQNDTFVKVQTTFTGFAVNKKLAPYIPQSLEQFLEPVWTKKVATTSIATGFEKLAADELWGTERTLAWARKFSGQIGGLVGCSDVDRLLSGEYLALVLDCGGSAAIDAIADGAPLERVVPVELPLISYSYLAVPKNAAHPNAARLLITYILSDEGQRNLGKMRGGVDLHLLPGSITGKTLDELVRKWGDKKVVEADIAWQLRNERANEAQRLIKDIFTRGN